MTDAIHLRGMTWDHPRGYDPLAACAAIWRERRGVQVSWERRSLQDFESFPVKELAQAYDLIVVDHPHVGQITGENCLAPLDAPGREAEREALARGSVGGSYDSYAWHGRQWAFPIDAAAQVQAFRPDLLDKAPVNWAGVLQIAQRGEALLALRPPHSLMSLYTLCGQFGGPGHAAGPDLFDPLAGARAYDTLAEIAGMVEDSCWAMDPIAVCEAMAQAGSRFSCSPLIYGYVNYALEGFRAKRLKFCDIPITGRLGPVGSALGGTGIAVSAYGRHIKAALDFAYWVASGEVQRGPYAQAGGQPGHADAWEAREVNAPADDFYRATRATLEGSWVRPRHDGYMAYQHQASERLNHGLRAGEGAPSVIQALNSLFAESLPR